MGFILLYLIVCKFRTEIKTQLYFTLTPAAWQVIREVSLERQIVRVFEFNGNVYSGYMGCDCQSTECDA